jgi:hypothetical protein
LFENAEPNRLRLTGLRRLETGLKDAELCADFADELFTLVEKVCSSNLTDAIWNVDRGRFVVEHLVGDSVVGRPPESTLQ